MRRRAFTLLELAIASFLGTMIIIATFGVFGAINRADRRTAARFDRSTQLAVLQRAVQRAWDSVVMADGAEGITGGRAATEAAAGADTGDEDPEAESEEPLQPLRIHLQADPAFEGELMTRRVRLEQGWGAGEPTPAQRLELALSGPPATQSADDYRRTMRLQEQGLLPVETGPEIGADNSVRGAFELRREDAVTAFGEQIYSLWWRPLARQDPVDPEEALPETPPAVDVALAEGAVKLVNEVIWARWRVFKGREWRDEFRAITVPDLPAYAELELTTPEMLTVNWIFEVAWTIGDDPAAAGEPGAQEDGEGEASSATSATTGASTQSIEGTTVTRPGAEDR